MVKSETWMIGKLEYWNAGALAEISPAAVELTEVFLSKIQKDV